MSNNLWKILNIIVQDDIIKRLDVYVDDLEKYACLNGYRVFQSAECIGSFYGEEAIATILKDMGFTNKMNLNLKENSYDAYIELSNFLASFSRVKIEDEVIVLSYNNLENAVTKVTLNKDESINTIAFNLNTNYGGISARYKEIVLDYIKYKFLHALCGEYSSEEELEEKLKKEKIVVTYNSSHYNYYKNLEQGSNKIVRKIKTSDGTTYLGVFIVNIKDTLLKFEALEKSRNLNTKEDIYKNTVFYISNNNIAYMQ